MFIANVLSRSCLAPEERYVDAWSHCAPTERLFVVIAQSYKHAAPTEQRQVSITFLNDFTF
jgi:hypothetical protein